MIHSSGDPSRGYSGPNYTDVTIGEGYWGTKFEGVYKWDTKPDTPENNSSPASTVPLNVIVPYNPSDKTRVSLPYNTADQ